MAKWKETMLQTGIDRFLEIVAERNSVSADDLAKELSLPPQTIETWANVLSKENMVSVDYNRAGQLVISVNQANLKEKKQKILELQESVEADTVNIEAKVKDQVKTLSEEHKDIERFEKILNTDLNLSRELDKELKALESKQNELQKLIKEIEQKESKLSKETVSITQIIDSKVELVNKTEKELKKFEDQKAELMGNVEIIRRLSNALQREPPEQVGKKIEDIEKDILEIKKASGNLDKKYSIIRKLVSKIR